MNRRSFIKHAAAGAIAGAALSTYRVDAATDASPNIILILADDLGYGHLGCYGQEHILTPNLDRLAREGIRFTQAYAGATVCAPSRSVLMTGYHGGHSPVRLNSGNIALRKEEVTVAEVLQQAGYATGAFGKWGLGEADTDGMPTRKGFDEFFGYLHQVHAQYYYPDYLWDNEERFPIPGNMDGKREQYSHDLIVDRALDFIRRHKDQRFFCYLPVTIPHHEWTVPEESLEPYSGKFPEDPPTFRWREGYALPKEPKANMAGMISHLDKSVGQVVDLLEQLDIRDDTLVIFTSDNGPDGISLANADFFRASGPLRGYKSDLYDGGIRVPAIAAWPGKIPGETVSDLVWHGCDFMPTFAELAGASAHVPKDVDGISIVPTLLGKSAADAQQQHDVLIWSRDGGGAAARMGDWKAVWDDEDAPIELYNLAEDIGEQRNVAEANPDVVAKLRHYMETEIVEPRPQIGDSAGDGRRYR